MMVAPDETSQALLPTALSAWMHLSPFEVAYPPSVQVDPESEVEDESPISGAGEREREDRARPSPIVIESRSSTWFFDTEHRRFRQVSKRDAQHTNASKWRPYDHLIEGVDAVLVFLDPQGSRVLRVRRTDRLTDRDRARS